MAVDPHFDFAVHAIASPHADPETIENILDNQDILPQFGVNSPLRIAHFLSQVGHESGGFRIAVENMRYTTARRLTQVWPRRFPTEASAAPFVNNPEKLGNRVYANRMGNGDEASGDGFRYRGRGLIQITGKEMYQNVGQLAGLDLVGNPELAASPNNALLIACGGWKFDRVDQLPENASVEAYTLRINGGTTGLADREALFKKVKGFLGLP